MNLIHTITIPFSAFEIKSSFPTRATIYVENYFYQKLW